MALPFTDYFEVPGSPGLMSFQRPDGGSVPLFGPVADDYRRRIDALRQLGPQPTAQNMSTPEPNASVAPIAAPMADATTGAPVADVPMSTPGASGSWEEAPEEPARRPIGASGSWDEEPAQQALAPVPGGLPAQRFYSADKSGRTIIDAQTGQVITRGSGGMSPARRDALESQFDQRADEISYRAAEQEHFARTSAELALQQARAEDQFVKARLEDAQINAALAAQNEAEFRGKLEQVTAAENRARQAYRSGTIDRDRYFAGDNGANKARAFLAIALGAFAQFGAGMAGRNSPNPGLEMVLNRIDDDVADQERELLAKREDADNYLAQAQRLEGNMQTARLSTKAALLEAYQTEALAIRNQTRQPQLKLQLDQRLAELDMAKQNTLAQLFALREQTLRAQQGAGVTKRPLTIEEAQKLTGVQKTRAEIGQTEASTEKTGVETVGAARELMQPGGGKKKSDVELKYELVTDAIWGDLDDLVKRMGGQVDPATGEIVGDLDMPTDLPGGDTESTSDLKSRLVKLGTSYANQINAGAEAGQATKEALTPGLNRIPGFDTSEGQLRAMAREIWRAKKGMGTLPTSGAKPR